MERACEVLPVLGVDPCLAADGGIDHPGERGGDGHPRNPAQVRRRREARDVGRRASAEGEKQALPAGVDLPP
jgi:hypothetical protein